MARMHSESRPAAMLMQLVSGKLVTSMIATAVQMNIADRLKDGPVAFADVAASAETDPDATYRLMRALSSVGVLVEHDGGRFSLSAVGHYLRTDVPGSLAGMAKLMGAGWHSALWAELHHCVKTGESAFQKVYGARGFDWLMEHPKELAVFNEAMTSYSAMMARAVVAAYDFSTSSCIADIGGGHGFLLGEILAANPNARGILYEQAPIAEAAKPHLAARDLASRCEVVAGDFFERVPPGCDLYVLKHIVHDWSDDKAVAVLANVARAMTATGKLLVIEQVMTAPGVPHQTKLVDLEMLVVTEGGRERTRPEYERLFERAGLRFTRVVATASPLSVLEAATA